jgi:predicted AAA+ superfamily ATPase
LSNFNKQYYLKNRKKSLLKRKRTPISKPFGVKSSGRLISDDANEKTLIIMRGLPGSGKSYKAKQIAKDFGGVIFSTDLIGGKQQIGNQLSTKLVENLS